MKALAIPALLLASLLSAGCVASAVGANVPPDETFDLLGEGAIGDTSPASGVQLLVPEPTTLRILASDQVVVRVTPRSLEYLAGVRLADTLTRMTQVKLQRALERGAGIGSVGVPGQGLAIDYQLVTDIRAFEIRANEGETAFVAITGKLLDDRTGNVIASRVFRASSPVAAPSAETDRERYIRALDAALTDVLIAVTDWTEQRT